MPAGIAQILEFFEIATGDAFDVSPAKAIEFFAGKGLQPTFSYADMLGDAHDTAFTVAKMMDVDLLSKVRDSLDSALANGQSFGEWRKDIMPTLQSAGWWGQKKKVDPDTGRLVDAQLGSPSRLETIFRTNMQSAYAAGHWQEIAAQADDAPFLMYDAVDDFRTRPLHASWDRKVLPVAHPWWSTHYPPNGYNCRCGVIQLDAAQLQQLGLQVAADAPDDGSYLWTNPRTGYALTVPRGIDPGFDHNPGQTMKAQAEKLLAEKLAAQGKAQQAAARRAMSKPKAPLYDGIAEATKAQAEMAAAMAQAALQRAQAVAAEKALQWQAQQQISAIAKGDKAALGTGAQYKVKALQALKKGDDWPELTPTQQLQQIDDLAAQLKAKAVLAQQMSSYKAAIVAGKIPPPAAVKAVNALPDADKAAFIAKVDAEKAAADAKKAAEAAAAAKAAQEAQEAAQAQQASAKASGLMVDAPPSPATMTVIGSKTKGGTEGAFYQDTATGQKYLVKFPGSEDAVRNEVLASKLYNLAGAQAPELHAIVIGGRPGLASRLIDGITEVDAKTLAASDSVMDGFAVDAWLANWDAVGLSFDNIVFVGGRAVRIDVGGSLRYRALGGLKGAAFGDVVTELDSLRDVSLNRQSAAVFGRITQQQMEDGVVRVLRTSDDDVRALVLRYGPTDPREAQILADRLIARKADLARRFPAAAARARALDGAADAAPDAPPRVTDTEQRFVEESRVNGYGFATDSDQIEDNMVLVHTFRTKAGADATRGFLKLTPGASRELLERVKRGAGDAPAVPLAQARDSILAAVKSINYRADKGQALDATVVMKVGTALDAIDAALQGLRAAVAAAKDAGPLQARIDDLTAWRSTLQAVGLDAKTGSMAAKLSRVFRTTDYPDEITFTRAQQQAAPAGLAWRRVAGTYEFETADFERSYAKMNGGRAGVHGTSLRYEADLPDGTRIVYFPHDDSGVAWAMQGVVKIDIPGKGVEATGRVFGALDAAGMKSVRATEVDRQHLYLNAFARIRLIRTPAYAEFQAIKATGEEGVRAKLGLIKRATGVDVFQSEGWKTVDGVRQAFGHGRAYQLRPDLTAAQLADLNRTHVVYHNPQGLGTDAGARVFDRLKVVIEGGGMFASLTDRVRRGVPLAGSSVSSDLASGGGDFLFTRIRERSNRIGTGVYWKTSVLRRMDAITYDSDQFGRTTAGHVEANRKGQDIASFKSVAMHGSNETIFKGGLSIFDDIDRIVLSSQAEVNDAVAWMKAKGYTAWPDGRALTEVIITKAEHAAKP